MFAGLLRRRFSSLVFFAGNFCAEIGNIFPLAPRSTSSHRADLETFPQPTSIFSPCKERVRNSFHTFFAPCSCPTFSTAFVPAKIHSAERSIPNISTDHTVISPLRRTTRIFLRLASAHFSQPVMNCCSLTFFKRKTGFKLVFFHFLFRR